MKKFFLPQLIVREAAFYGGEEITFKRKGYIGLFSRNDLRVYYFKNPIVDDLRWGYVAERSECPRYFKQVIIEEASKDIHRPE